MSLWLAQLLMDGLLLGVGLVWLWGKRSTTEPIVDNSAEKLRHMELELTRYREKMDAQLMLLKRICDDAARILSQAKEANSTISPSREEEELKSVFASTHQIPSLTQVEKTRGRLESEIRVDLKSLLRDQLV